MSSAISRNIPYELRVADEFVEALASVYSERLLSQIRGILDSLATTPKMGSAQVRPALTERYGEGIRKIAVSTFVIIYRPEDTHVDVLALVYGPSIE